MSSSPSYRSQEAKLTTLLGVILLGNAFAQKLSEIISVSSFFSNVGVNQIIWVWMVDGMLMLLVAGLQSLIIDRHSRRKIMEYMVMALALSFVFLQIIILMDGPAWFSQSLLFLLSQQQWLTFPLIFWVFTNDLLGIAQSKRLIPKIASWGFAGYALGIAFVGFTSLIMKRLAIPHDLMVTGCLAINIAIYSGIFLVLRLRFTHYKIRQVAHVSEPLQQTLSEGWDFIRNVDLFRYLVIAVLAIVVCETIIDFRFFQASFAAFPDLYTYQMIQSGYLFGRAIIEGLISQFLAQALITQLSLKAVFTLQPLFSLVASSLMLVVPTFLGSLGGIILHKGAQYGIDEPARKALEGLVPQERRGRVSNFIDGYMLGAGGILGALIIALFSLIGWVMGVDLLASNGYLFGAVIAALIALISTWKMYQVYDISMLDWRLHRRKRGDSILNSLDF
jgi:ATP:ADP antiporter, AAA family